MSTRRLIPIALIPIVLVCMLAPVILTPDPALGAGPLRVVQALVDDPLENADSVIISGDSQHLYAIGHSALVAFERDFATGTARFLGAHYDGHGGVNALRGATSLALSPDGRFLYVSSPRARQNDNHNSAGVAIFARDGDSGSLSFVGVQGLWASSDLDQAVYLAMAPDGARLYMVSSADRCLVTYLRDPDDGSLSAVSLFELSGFLDHVFVEVTSDSRHVYLLHDQRIFVLDRSSDGLRLVDEETEGLGGVRGMARGQSLVISPDGRHVYVLSASEPDFDNDGTVVVFARDTESGEIDYLSTVHDPGRSDLDGATRGVMSRDGAFLYVALDSDRGSTGTSAVVVLARDAESGGLSFVELIGDDDFSRGQALALTAEDNLIYMGSFQGRTLFPFRRDAESGLLEPAADSDDPAAGAGLMRGAVAVASSADGEQIYVAGHFNHAVTTYQRQQDGSLEFASTLNAVAHGVKGLRGVRAIAVSPRDPWVFAGGDGASVTLLERNAETGTLREHAALGSGGTKGLAVSPDGRHVYAVGEELFGVRAYEVTAAGGIEEIWLELPARQGLGFLSRPRAVALSSDGKFVYVAGFYDCGTSVNEDDIDTLTVFRRHPERGTLTVRGVLVLGGNSIDRFPPRLAVAPEGEQIYLGRPKANSVLVINHNSVGKQVRLVQTVAQGRGGVHGLGQPRDIVLSPSGNRLYVAGRGADAVAVFDRNARGRLAFVGATSENDEDAFGGLLRPLGLAITADGNLHAVSLRSSGVTVLTPAE